MTYKKYSSSKTSRKNRKVIIVLCILGLIILGGAVWTFNKRTSNNQGAPAPTYSESSDINYNPPTNNEVEAGDKQKDEIVEDNQSPDQATRNAEVVIVDASQYGDEVEVRAFVSNLIEDGQCIITFSKDSNEFSKTVSAFADASTTPCMNLLVPRNEFSSTGTWEVSVTFKSSNSSGVTRQSLIIE